MKKLIKNIFFKKKVEAKLSRGAKGTNWREGVRGRRGRWGIAQNA